MLTIEEVAVAFEPVGDDAELMDKLITEIAEAAVARVRDDVLIAVMLDESMRVTACHDHWMLIAIVLVVDVMNVTEHVVILRVEVMSIEIVLVVPMLAATVVVEVLVHGPSVIAELVLTATHLAQGVLRQVTSHGDLRLA